MPDHQYRWLVVAYTLVLQAVTVGTIIYCFALFAGPWLEQFNAERADVMFAIAALQLSFGLLSPFVGSFMDRLRMRRIVLFGAACFAVGWVIVSQATELWHVLVAYAAIFPLAMTCMGTLASQTLITRWFADRRGVAIGVSAVGTNLGGVVLPLIVAPLLLGGAWREVAVWLLVGGLTLIVPLTWVVLARRSPKLPHAHASVTAVTMGSILRSRTFKVASLALLPVNLTFGAVQFNLGVFARDLGFEIWAGEIIALCSICMIAGKLIFGSMADRFDHRVLHWIAVTAMTAAMFLLQGQPGATRLVFGVICVGIAGGSLLPVMGVIVGARFALSSFGRAMGLMMLTLSLASIGPMLAGWIYDTQGSYDMAFMLFAGLLAPSAILMWWLPPPLPVGSLQTREGKRHELHRRQGDPDYRRSERFWPVVEPALGGGRRPGGVHRHQRGAAG